MTIGFLFLDKIGKIFSAGTRATSPWNSGVKSGFPGQDYFMLLSSCFNNNFSPD